MAITTLGLVPLVRYGQFQPHLPVFASGGAGSAQHFAEAFGIGASGALAASVFHDRRIAIPDLKRDLAAMGVEVRL